MPKPAPMPPIEQPSAIDTLFSLFALLVIIGCGAILGATAATLFSGRCLL